MEVLYPKCAGLDVHKDTVVACVRLASGSSVRRESRTFSTRTSDLLRLSDWLGEFEVTHVGMEATGVYWKPVWHILEGSFELVLANAMHVKNVPGRKTDMNDAAWLADLLAHGLIRASFVPPRRVQELRDLTRTRKQLTREVAQHTLRIQKTLEDANIKITGLVSDILGVSGRSIIEQIISGVRDPEALADLARRQMKKKRPELVEALRGTVTKHHRFLLRTHLALIDALNAQIEEVDRRIGAGLDSFRTAAERLTTMPGIGETTAQVLLAEIGADMSRFPSAKHLVSWAGLCPRSDESAGKKRNTRIRQGARWLKATLVQAAWSAVRTKNSYLRSQYYRIRARRGPKKAIIAVAASMLTAAYYMLRDDVDYRDLGPGHYDQLERSRTVTRLLRRLRDLNVQIEVRPSQPLPA